MKQIKINEEELAGIYIFEYLLVQNKNLYYLYEKKKEEWNIPQETIDNYYKNYVLFSLSLNKVLLDIVNDREHTKNIFYNILSLSTKFNYIIYLENGV